MEAFREARSRRARRQAVTLVRAVRAARARAKAETPPPPVDGGALRDLLAEVAADARLVEVPANRPPWTAAGIRVTAGDQVTWLAWGAAHLAKPLGISWGPSMVLIGRVADGPERDSARDTFTFTAEGEGPVELRSRIPAEPRGDGSFATDRVPYRAIPGDLRCVVVRWLAGTDPRAALASISERDASGLCAAEAARLADPPPQPPPGWDHHPLIGAGEIYAPSERGITTHTARDVGIVCRPVDVPLTPTLRLRWSWRLDELPSRLPEDTPLTHDYLSVALEFDDGQDLTWHWSSSLPPGFAYRCPLEHWRHRETHIVTRSGTADLGRWVDEDRPVLADHRVAIGGPAPARVVRAWLIAVSCFQMGEGRGEFGPIELVDADQVIRVLGAQDPSDAESPPRSMVARWPSRRD
jgi:hypothetical protein